MNKTFPHIFLFFCRGLSNDDVGVSTDTVFQEVRQEAGFQTGYFVQEKLGGGTVERLVRSILGSTSVFRQEKRGRVAFHEDLYLRETFNNFANRRVTQATLEVHRFFSEGVVA